MKPLGMDDEWRRIPLDPLDPARPTLDHGRRSACTNLPNQPLTLLLLLLQLPSLFLLHFTRHYFLRLLQSVLGSFHPPPSPLAARLLYSTCNAPSLLSFYNSISNLLFLMKKINFYIAVYLFVFLWFDCGWKLILLLFTFIYLFFPAI